MNRFPDPLARLSLVNTLAGVLLWLAWSPAEAQEQNPQLQVITAQVRRQGFVCENPISVERIKAGSLPDEPLYLLKCEGARYRVRLIPDRAAEILNEVETSRASLGRW